MTVFVCYVFLRPELGSVLVLGLGRGFRVTVSRVSRGRIRVSDRARVRLRVRVSDKLTPI